MPRGTNAELRRHIRHIGFAILDLTFMGERGQLDESDRNVSSALSALKEARDSVQRLIAGEEHPDAVAARQAGAETLRKLGYGDAIETAKQISGRRTIPDPPTPEEHMRPVVISREALDALQPGDYAVWPKLGDDLARQAISQAYRKFMQGFKAAASAPAADDPDWNSPEDAVYDEPPEHCPNCRSEYTDSETGQLHGAPCQYCTSDGHAACQSPDGRC